MIGDIFPCPGVTFCSLSIPRSGDALCIIYLLTQVASTGGSAASDHLSPLSWPFPSVNQGFHNFLLCIPPFRSLMPMSTVIRLYMLMSLDKVVLIPFTFMFSLKENESCCIAEDANVLTASLDSGDGFTSPLFSPNFSVLSLFFFFFRQGFTGGPATCMQLHQRSREKKQALLLALCLMGLGVSLFLIWVESRVYPGVGSKGCLGGVGREHAQYLALLPTPCFCSWLSRNGSRGSLVF